MFLPKDNTYNDIRDKSYLKWLDEMEQHPDPSVRCGVKLARDYVEYLKEQNRLLKEENELKNTYLRKVSSRKAGTGQGDK